MTETALNEEKQPVQIDKNEDRTWATFCHLAGLAIFIAPPIGNVIGPLIVWLIKKNEMPLVDEAGKSALNFQISMSIYILIAAFTILFLIGFLLVPALVLLDVILSIIAAVKTSNGEKFEYPLSLKFIK